VQHRHGVPVDLLDMGLVKDLRLDGGTAHVELIVTSPLCTQIGLIVDRVREVLAEVDGVGSVEVTVDARAQWWPGMMAASARQSSSSCGRPGDALGEIELLAE
jgi:metal-sulfur cluster biosynthetic enzyme